MKFSQTKLKDLTGKYGSPLIVYNEQELIESYEYLAASLGGAKLVYSVKANPNPGIIKTLSENDAMFETASEIEYKLLRRIGINPLRIIYGGQGKKKEGIRQAIQEGVFLFNLESQHEVKLLVECAEEEKKKCEFLLRINPENSSKVSVLQMSGCPSAFGIDVEYVDETLELCKSKYAKFVGFFMYNGSQYYDACEIVNNTKYLVELAKKYSGKYEIEYLDFGGGFGVIETEEQKPLNIESLQLKLEKMDVFTELPNLKMTFYESGRYISTVCGTLISKVIDTKWSKGKRFAILDTGITCLGVRQYCYRLYEPFTDFITQNKERIPQTLVGPTCTSIDNICTDVTGNKLSIGDYVLFKYAGSYLLTYSPVYFCGQSTPCEVIEKNDGTFELLKRSTNIVSDFGYIYEGE